MQVVPGYLELLDINSIQLQSLGLLLPSWQGPFSIVAQTAAPNTYKLTLPAAWKVVNKFNILNTAHTRNGWGRSSQCPLWWSTQ